MREFSVGGDGLTLANAAVTLVFVNPAAAPKPTWNFMRMWASQQGSATSAQQRIEVETQVTAFPTLVSATPRPEAGDTNASFIVRAAPPAPPVRPASTRRRKARAARP
jgi:hypothetical protein